MEINNIILPVFFSIFLCISIAFTYSRLQVICLFLQQSEYSTGCLLKFGFSKLKLIDKILTLTTIGLSVCLLFFSKAGYAFYVLASIAMCPWIIKDRYFVSSAKKKLVITMRMKRTIALYSVVPILAILLEVFFLKNWLVVSLIHIFCIHYILFGILLANEISIHLIEKKIQKKYINLAKNKIKKLNPIVIGITGSYGKTSTKHALQKILSIGDKDTICTPGGVNSEMGVCRFILEDLQPKHKYAIVEMGAYYIGSIKKICNIVNPRHGILTTIGVAHIEKFGSKDNICKAKGELFEAVKKNGGVGIVDGDIEKKYLTYYKKILGENLISVSALHAKYADFFISNCKIGVNGLSFKIEENNENSIKLSHPEFKDLPKEFHVKNFFAQHFALDLSEAILMSMALKLYRKKARTDLVNLETHKNRLSVKKINGITFINNAYNSNPVGFVNGVELLKVLQNSIGRTIIVTPGMVELGKIHNAEHFNVGKKIGKIVDIALIIRPSRVQSLLDGIISSFKNGNAKTKIITFQSLKDATNWMDKHLMANDVVLIENDLPDWYENDYII